MPHSPHCMLLSFLLFLSLSVLMASGAVAGTVEPRLAAKLSSAATAETIPVIVRFRDDVNSRAYRHLEHREARRQLVSDLKERYERSTGDLKQMLRQGGVGRIKDLWHINATAFVATPELIASLQSWPGVETVELDAVVTMEPIQTAAAGPIEWNVLRIRASDVWNQGFDGTGATVAIIDSGVDWLHPELGNWRGGPGDWFDPVDGTLFPEEKSRNSHGTAVAGLAVGQNVNENIGVAPGATWIAAAPFFPDPEDPNNADIAFESDLHDAFAWALDPDGNGDPSDAPDIVNNSWGGNGTDSCLVNFRNDFDLLKAAGIAVVFSAGNDPGLSTSPANNANTVAVGATDINDDLAIFSSTGPSPCDPPGEVFPELVAPGVNVFSAFTDIIIPGNPMQYSSYSGTSFSAPHVAGALALLRSAYPDVPMADLEAALIDSAIDLGASGPDNDYGHGLADVFAAWELIGFENTPPPAASLVLPLDLATVSANPFVRLQWRQTADPDGDLLEHFLVIADNDQFVGSQEFPAAASQGSGVYVASTAGLLVGLLLLRRRRPRRLLLLAVTLLMLSCGSSGGGGGSNGTLVTFDLAGLAPGTTYFWKVRTADARGAEVDSSVRSFTTE